MLSLWCGLGGLGYYPQRLACKRTERFLDRAAAAGVDSLRFYFSFAHLISQLNCWHPQGLRDAATLLRAAEIALDEGADSVGVYRADAVEALELWPVIS